MGGSAGTPDPDALKILAISYAREQVKAGAHYLWGGAGNTPGNSDGAPYRTSYTKLHDNVPDLTTAALENHRKEAPYTPMLFAAYANTSDQGVLACSGRAAVMGHLPLALPIEVKDAIKIKVKDLTADQFEELKKKSADPASVRWPRPNGLISNNAANRSTVWAESCLGKRHFDCIGLVNWCLSTALGKTVQYGVSNFKGGIALSKAKAGDIVTIGTVHIGIVTEAETVIEAEDVAHGVVERPIKEGGWTDCTRLSNSTWRLGT